MVIENIIRQLSFYLSIVFLIFIINPKYVSCQEITESPIPSADANIWNLSVLNNSPKMKWLNNHKGIPYMNYKLYALFYEGLPYKGNSTGVFAFYATPGLISGNPESDKNLPGVILVHGGTGHADPIWVIDWAKRGYAALAMDLSGCGPDRRTLPNSIPTDDYTDYDLNYHMVANTILAHSLLLSFKEIDREKTAVVGISIGGQVTYIVACVDKRFKAAVPIYGCGYLYDNSLLSERLSQMEKKKRDKWIKHFDPSSYIESIKIPILFVAGTRDEYYPMDSYVRTLQRYKGVSNYCINPEIEHSQTYGTRIMEPYLFVEQYCKGGIPLPSIEKPIVIDGQVRANFKSKTKPVRATLYYTRDLCSFENRVWNSIDATIRGSTIMCPNPPGDSSAWIVTLEDDRNATVSSELILE